MSGEVEKLRKEIEKKLSKFEMDEVTVGEKTYPLYVFDKDEDINLFEGFLYANVDSKEEFSLLSSYKPSVSGYAGRIGIIIYKNHEIYIRDYRTNRQIRKTISKLNEPFLKKLRKVLEEPKSENFSALFSRSDVIEEFYVLYKKCREFLLKNIRGISEEERREEFVDNFMMQMLTLWYLQEKGFFNRDKRYFITKFMDLKQKRLFGGFESYYAFLRHFFKQISGHSDEPYVEDESIGKCVVIGPAVFLNGDDDPAITIPDKCFYQEGVTEKLVNLTPKGRRRTISEKDIDFDIPLLNLFESRDWVDGDIDEYVLGSLYEKLITYMERKKLGAFYTPEEITSYICKNTIEPYLVDRINEKFGKNYESIDELINAGDREELTTLFDLLQNIKILDPAVGSAHFLESAINVLVDIYRKLRDRAKEVGIEKLEILVADEDGRIKPLNLLEVPEKEGLFEVYVKFFIILSRNIYGVDINPSALKVARARLFLTLARHFDVNSGVFIRFPNVHFNLREGNSLIGYVNVPRGRKETTQVTLDFNFEDHEIQYIQERIKVDDELKEYLPAIARSLRIEGGLVREVEEMNRILASKKIKWSEFEKVLKTKEKLIRVLVASLNSRYAVKLNKLLREITELFNNKLDERFAEEHGIDLEDLKKIKTFHWIFEFPEVFLEKGGFDVVVENPPWDAVKPVEKEFFSYYDSRLTKYGVDKQEARRIIQELLKNPHIKERWGEYKEKIRIESAFYRESGVYMYQSDVIGGKKVGGDLNYYKLFLERSYQLLRPKGYLGILVPSGIYTDAGTKGLRKLFFENGRTKELYCFENRRKIFPIDIRFKFTIFINQKSGKTEKFYGAFMLHDVGILNEMPQKAITIDWEMVKKFSPDSWSVIEFKSQKDVDIVEKMYQHPIIKENEWLGKVEFYTEFHMTNDSELFNKEGRGLRLYEGKMIEQYDPYFEDTTYWIEENVGKEKLYGNQTNKKKFDYKEYRLGFRAVASSTNRRSMIASILPKNVFCGNSIIVITLYDEEDNRLIPEDRLLYLCGVFNSFVFDYLLRLKITTNLNMFFIYQMPVPVPDEETFQRILENVIKLTEDWEEFEKLRKKYGIQPRKLSKEERLKIIAEIDALVARLYGLTKDELQYILDKFHHKDPEIEAELRKMESLILQVFDEINE